MATSENSENKAKPICNELEIHEDCTDIHPLYSKMPRFTVRDGFSSRPYRQIAIILGLLSAVLILVITGLSVHINRISESHNTLSFNSSRISSELAQLQAKHNSLIAFREQLLNRHDEDTKTISSLHVNLNAETKLKNDLSSQNHDLQEEKRKLKTQITNLEDNCGRCLPNWVLMNTTCYYFAVSDAVPRKSWDGGRQECTKKGADLVVIDTKEKQEFIVDTLKTLRYNLPFGYRNGFWIGLKDDHTEGIWKWINSTTLTEGYWMDGEPNDQMGTEDCAAVYPSRSPWKSWNDAPCSFPLKWICEKEIDKIP